MEKAFEEMMERSRQVDDEANRVRAERDRLLVAEAQLRTECDSGSVRSGSGDLGGPDPSHRGGASKETGDGGGCCLGRTGGGSGPTPS